MNGMNRKDGAGGVDRLWDSQWVNIVNAPEVLNAENQEDAVNIAVRMTEQKMAENARLREHAGVNYAKLAEYAETYKVNYNVLCRYVREALTPQPPAEAQAQGGGEVVAIIQRPGWPRKDSAVYFTMEHAAYDLPPGTPLYTAPPSAPVGVEAIKSAIAELDALRNAMFKTYAAAANGAAKAKLLRLIEAERNAYEAHYSLPKLREALAQQPAAVECDCPSGRADHASWCAVSKAQDAAQPGGSDNDR